MGWSVAALSLVVLCSVSSGTGVKTTVVAPTALVEAEQRVKKLADLFSDIRSNMRPRHCADLLRAGQTTSGLYDIFIGKDDVKGKVVYCDMETDGGGWTVIQRRGQFGNRVYYFYRNWKDYATGFGDPAKEYWFGNRALHALTSNAECMKLKIVLKNHTGESVSVDYESIKVGSEKDHFRLSLGRFLGPKDSITFCWTCGIGARKFSSGPTACPCRRRVCVLRCCTGAAASLWDILVLLIWFSIFFSFFCLGKSLELASWGPSQFEHFVCLTVHEETSWLPAQRRHAVWPVQTALTWPCFRHL
nr:techylectin-5A-like isoform X1 [Dermacentor andersoni]XP_054923502.1 techylectin-5A-like isoform X1 [Dermacentor andersoni]XP_054923503.1 techylectin-5A-like isoform X1 [Dermacentor andersoni]